MYLVASLFYASKLRVWYNNSNSDYINKAHNAIEEVVFKLSSISQNAATQGMARSETFDSLQSEQDLYYTHFSQNTNPSQNSDSTTGSLLHKIKTEKFEFLNYLQTKDLRTIKATRSFWAIKVDQFPNLSKAALILYNIPASSAFFERYFSICGIICKKNCGNMSADMIIKRSMLKANFNLIDVDDTF